jgi:hypothetical protein
MRDWNELRARLSHDLVKNRLVPATIRMINIVGGKIEADPLETFDSTITIVWTEADPSLKFLFESCESALSPRNYFLVEPLVNCPPSTMEWLPDLIHELWLERHDVQSWCKSGSELVADMAAAIRDASVLLTEPGLDESHRKSNALDAMIHLQEKSVSLSMHLSLIDNRLLI